MLLNWWKRWTNQRQYEALHNHGGVSQHSARYWVLREWRENWYGR